MRLLELTVRTGILLSLVYGVSAADNPIIIIDDVRYDRIEYAGIELKRGGEFTVEAVGLRGYDDGGFIAYGWILDSDTREPVWKMKRRNTERHGRRGLVKADDKIDLQPGKYELYYYVGNKWGGKIVINGRNVIEFLGDLFEGDFDGDIDEYIEDFYISLIPEDEGYSAYERFDPTGKIDDALVQVNKVGDSEYIEKGFSLDKDTEIRVYALCEYPSGYKSPVDLAWIINADTREKVWEMDRWNTDHAGGGNKNKFSDDEIKLDKGRYILYYVTDDSHSWDYFNVPPPYDPLNWGVALISTRDADKSAFKTFTPEGKGEPLVDLTRMGDDEFESQAFELKSEQSLHIHCLGEYSSWSKEFVDYGWIENAENGKTVWDMTKRNTVHAGGGSKNRKFDKMITLPKGYYIAHYITDDSHSYRDWNTSAPYEGNLWGLAIYPGVDFKKSDFKLLRESEVKLGADILVKMTGLRDNERERAKFTLSKQTKIHIYAIGEGSRDEMYDYGWIIDDNTGRAVWEMSWRNTEPAGGARKNRMFRDTIILEPGTYVVNFVTDGSHSFNDWNASKPRDPVNWGITVSRE
ncbi:MAG: hypothetical protein JSW64_10960 [Candidatus Zixiibacteriota bacterium]|nr:MAG: hypothetical protein JSW64_10960 [candidate division Zixibacteria bacterium]